MWELISIELRWINSTLRLFFWKVITQVRNKIKSFSIAISNVKFARNEKNYSAILYLKRCQL